MAVVDMSSAYFIFLSCLLVLLIVWYWILMQTLVDNEEEESRAIGRDIESATAVHTSLPETRNVRFETANARARRIIWHQTLSFFTPKTHIARLAVRALPPVIAFQEDETPHSQTQCPICIEQFRNGELIQPFGLCSHQFHPSCINSWLFRGNTNCPVCRMELPITSHHWDHLQFSGLRCFNFQYHYYIHSLSSFNTFHFGIHFFYFLFSHTLL